MGHQQVSQTRPPGSCVITPRLDVVRCVGRAVLFLLSLSGSQTQSVDVSFIDPSMML